MARSIPDRWLDYKPIGEPIKGTRFIAFKVPLNPAVNERIPDTDKRLQISQILEKLPNLGLVIDLTNTHRYYKPEGFSSNGVKHIKLMIPGKEVPRGYLVEKFTNYVKQFIENSENDGKLIGVHCTHGLNRTGYLICHYMINNLQIQPDDAIKDFEEARGHQMERHNYLDCLKNPTQNSSPQHHNDSEQIEDKRNIDDRRRHPDSWRSSIRRPENNEYPRRSRFDRPFERRTSNDDRPQQRSLHTTDENHVESWRSRRGSDHREHRGPYEGNSNYNRPQYDRNRSRNPENGGRQFYNNRDSRAGNSDEGRRRSYQSNQRRPRNGYDRSNNDDRRRDPLPSNDFSSNFSVMDQLYSDSNQNGYGRFDRR